jgi:Spy/CpxP family protein refolding chaperone
MNRAVLFAFGTSFGLLVATLWNVSGFQRPAHRGAPIQDVLEDHRAALELDEATLEASWAIADGAKEELDAYHEQIREERAGLEDVLQRRTVDPRDVEARVARIGELETRLRTRELQTMLQIRALLTPTQVDALRAMQAPEL